MNYFLAEKNRAAENNEGQPACERGCPFSFGAREEVLARQDARDVPDENAPSCCAMLVVIRASEAIGRRNVLAFQVLPDFCELIGGRRMDSYSGFL